MGADYMFVRVKVCHTSCKEGEQLSRVVVDAHKVRPVSRNTTLWLNASTNFLSSLDAYLGLKTFREIFVQQAAAEPGCMNTYCTESETILATPGGSMLKRSAP